RPGAPRPGVVRASEGGLPAADRSLGAAGPAAADAGAVRGRRPRSPCGPARRRRAHAVAVLQRRATRALPGPGLGPLRALVVVPDPRRSPGRMTAPQPQPLRDSPKRVLFLSGLQLHPTLSGGQLRSFGLATALRQHGLDVFVYSFVGRKADYLA